VDDGKSTSAKRQRLSLAVFNNLSPKTRLLPASKIDISLTISVKDTAPWQSHYLSAPGAIMTTTAPVSTPGIQEINVVAQGQIRTAAAVIEAEHIDRDPLSGHIFAIANDLTVAEAEETMAEIATQAEATD